MFGAFTGPEELRRYVGELAPRCTALRGAYIVRDETSPKTQLLICATNPGTHNDDFHRTHSRELAIIRSELPSFGVEEVFFADLHDEGYILVVEPIEPIEKSEILGDGCWTYTPEGEVELGRLLRGLGELAWRAWEEVVVPQVAQQALEEQGTESEEDSGSEVTSA
jgi:hypothetical protein